MFGVWALRDRISFHKLAAGSKSARKQRSSGWKGCDEEDKRVARVFGPCLTVGMAWHIKIGKLSWCKSPYAGRSDLAMVARDEGILLICSHIDRAKAHKMVECLQGYGLDYARVVEGVCDECGDWKGRTR
jgi:hypothetical protein